MPRRDADQAGRVMVSDGQAVRCICGKYRRNRDQKRADYEWSADQGIYDIDDGHTCLSDAQIQAIADRILFGEEPPEELPEVAPEPTPAPMSAAAALDRLEFQINAAEAQLVDDLTAAYDELALACDALALVAAAVQRVEEVAQDARRTLQPARRTDDGRRARWTCKRAAATAGRRASGDTRRPGAPAAASSGAGDRRAIPDVVAPVSSAPGPNRRARLEARRPMRRIVRALVAALT